MAQGSVEELELEVTSVWHVAYVNVKLPLESQFTMRHHHISSYATLLTLSLSLSFSQNGLAREASVAYE